MSDEPTNAGGASGDIPSPSWFSTLSPEDQGFLQNRGLDKLDAQAAAQQLLKSYREASTKLGAPAEEMIRIRKDAPEAERAELWKKLGKPDEAAGYDLSAVTMDEKFGAAFREAAHKAHLTNAAALQVADAIAKHNQATATETKAAEEEAARQEFEKLQTNWGPNWDVNHFLAKKAAQMGGVSDEEIAALQKGPGGAKVMEMFRRFGAMSTEARHIPGGGQPDTGEMTYEAALARREEMYKDRAWFERFYAGGAAEKREFNEVTQRITRGNMAARR